jgi:glucose/arabinose dehydrogenase
MSIVARQREHPTSNVEHRTSKDQSSTLNVDLFVFDRSGIWKLIDSNNDRECDRYEMFCNLPAQTAETREFPNSMKLGSDGSLYISKGGQEGTTRGKHNGTVIKVAPDGKSFEVIGYGLRQPFIGVHPETGLVTASDQQGHYVPSTPLHIIGGHRFYGHLPTIAEKEKYPEAIADPLTWLPHPVNPSGVTQTWLVGAKMGPINDELIHIGCSACS